MTFNNTKIKQMTLIGLMTAVLCILAPIAIPLPISPIPISLGNMAVCFVVSVLGFKSGTLSVLLYLILGLTGIPVFLDSSKANPRSFAIFPAMPSAVAGCV